MAVLRSLEERWNNKEREVAARIQLQEVVANIDLLTEIEEGNFDVDRELVRLKRLEKDFRDVVDSSPSLDWTVAYLDLPQVSDDTNHGDPSDGWGEESS